jgi:CheY-like chemotaxis protein
VLAEVVDEATRLMRASLPSTIALRSGVSADGATVLADASQVHQVLLNLCTNAAQSISAARASGGIIAVDVDRASITAEQAQRLPGLSAGPHVVLSVQDNGAGLGDDIRTRIFEPFFTTKAPGEGTGLGLAAVHGIVREHGGAIEVESVEGQGATFRVYFPECAPVAEPVPATPAATSSPGFGHVLLVDDEASIAYVSSRLLEAGGFSVTTFTDPRLALAAFESAPHAFDALVTDLTMPKLSGLELVRLTRAMRPDLPVVMATGYLQGLSESTVAALRMTLLLKPYDGDDLCEAVVGVMARARRAPDGGTAPNA